MSTFLIIYFALGVIFTALNIDYRARFSLAGVPLLLFTILIWPFLLVVRILVTLKRFLTPPS